MGKIEIRQPRLAQRLGGGARKAGKALDAVELTEVGGFGLGDRGLQRIRVDGLQKSTGQSRGQMLDGQRLQAVTPFGRGPRSGLRPCEA
ncbi:hypothetical protein WOB59_02270 [Methylocystis sp. IM4]|uniref:hypothetical protein n=1 Tax=Methylocystis sp. IM4 TaxID=3136560 RepID=UPI00311A7CAC